MRLGKTAFSHFLSQVVVTLSGFAATWLIAVVLGADGLGRYSIVVSLGFFWLIIPINAVSAAVKKRMSESDDPAPFLGGGLILNTVFALGLAVIVLVAGELLGGIVSRNRELMIVLIEYDVEIATLLVAAAAYRSTLAGLQGGKQVATSGWLKAGERALRTGLQVAALIAGLAVTGISLGHAGSLAAVAVVALAVGRYRPSLPAFNTLRSLVRYARWAWVGALRGRVFGWFDTIVLSFFVSATLIGIYEAAWGIASMLAIASSSISQTLFPEVSDLSTDAGYDRIRHYLDEALAFSAILVIPGLAGAAVIGERVLRFYRPEFGQGSAVLLVLTAAYLADTFAAQFTNVINGVDRPDAAFRVNLAFICVNAVLNVVLVWAVGWTGAAIATAVASGLRAAMGYWVARSILGELSVPTGQVARQGLAALTMAVFVAPLAPIAPPGRIGTILLVGFGALIYGGVLLGIAPRVRSKALSFVPESA